MSHIFQATAIIGNYSHDQSVRDLGIHESNESAMITIDQFIQREKLTVLDVMVRDGVTRIMIDDKYDNYEIIIQPKTVLVNYGAITNPMLRIYA
jgi:hypothetical protein